MVRLGFFRKAKMVHTPKVKFHTKSYIGKFITYYILETSSVTPSISVVRVSVWKDKKAPKGHNSQVLLISFVVLTW